MLFATRRDSEARCAIRCRALMPMPLMMPLFRASMPRAKSAADAMRVSSADAGVIAERAALRDDSDMR